jgi:hypothetical protein
MVPASALAPSQRQVSSKRLCRCPRGNLPLPFALVYDGTGQAGEAGVGWSVPFYTVRRSTSLHRRKPLFATGEPAERILLTLGGSTLLMNPTGTPRTYRPFASDTQLKLLGPSEGDDRWLLHDAAGREYAFSRIDGFAVHAPVWYLTQISDSSRKNKVVLRYNLDTGCSSSAPDLLLREIGYSFDATGMYGKHLIRVDYRTWSPTSPHVPTCVPDYPNPQYAMVLARVVDDGFDRIKSRIIEQIMILSQVVDPPLTSDYRPLRTYLLRYSSDPDTTLPRLSDVDVKGTQADAGALPVARYEYGSLGGHNKSAVASRLVA